MQKGGIQFRDVQCGGASVARFLRRSKTDRVGKGKYVHVYGIPGGVSCPVTAVREFLGILFGSPGWIYVISVPVHFSVSPLFSVGRL